MAESHDSLLSCILYLAELHGNAASRDAVVAGLPLSESGEITPALVPKACKRVGLSASIQAHKLTAIREEALPAILILNNDKACILARKGDAEDWQLTFPDLNNGTTVRRKRDIEDIYSGFVVYALPIESSYGENNVSPQETYEGHWFFSVFKQEWWSYAQVMLAAFLLNLFALASPLYVMNVYDRVVPNNAMESLWVLSVGFAIVLCFDFIIKTLRGMFVDRSGKKLDIVLENRLFDRILDMHLKEKPHSSGALANVLRELEVIREFFTSATLVSFVDLPFIFIFIGLFWYIGGPIAFVFMIALPIIIGAGLIIHFPLRQAVEKSIESGHDKHSVLVETLTNLETVKTLGCEAFLRKRWSHNATLGARHSIRSRALSFLTMNITATIHQFAYICIIITGVYLISDGQLTTGGLIACSILSGRVMAPFSQIAQLITKLQHARSSYKRLDEIMQKPSERPISKRFIKRDLNQGNLTFKNVSFTYPEGDQKALDSVSINIAGKEKVGIIGKTGSGKSTIGKLLLDLYEPDDGSVLIDNTDIRQLDPADVRSSIGYVPQDVALFNGSLRQNLTMGCPQASDKSILNASFIAGLNEFVRIHPRGFDLTVGERGCRLSGGQRQAVAIARALISNPAVLLLDEPTSSMDSRSEELFMNRIQMALSNRTLVLITHKPTLLALVDRLIVIDQGKIVEDGPKSSILKKLADGKVKNAKEDS